MSKNYLRSVALGAYFGVLGAAAAFGGEYTVKDGDTLSGIARRFPGVKWTQIAQANGIEPPYTIHPGDELEIPEEGLEDKAEGNKRSCGDTQEEIHGYIDHIVAKSSREDVDRNLCMAFLESRIRHYNQDGSVMTGNSDDVGIYQITPIVIRDLNRKAIGKKSLEGKWSWKRVQIDPLYNIEVAIAYLNLIEGKFRDLSGKDREEAEVASFNCGYGRVKGAIRRARQKKLKDPTSFDTYRLYLVKAQKRTGTYITRYRILKGLIGKFKSFYEMATNKFEVEFKAAMEKAA